MNIEANIAFRKAGETIAELIQAELKPLVKQYGTECLPAFFGVLRTAYGSNLRVAEPGPLPAQSPATPANRPPQGDPASDALEQIATALELVDDVPERGREFAESVAGKLRSIAETIEEAGEVTAGQLGAIENMRGGLEKWIR